MKKLVPVILSLGWLASAAPVYCADAKAELQDLVGKVKTKLQTAGSNPTEQDLAPEFSQFDALVAEHKGEKTDDVANILFMEGILYAQVFSDYAKATPILQQVKTQFPNSSDAKRIDAITASFAKQEEAKKIQDKLVVGAPFPNFSVQDLNGKPLSVAADKGKVVLIDFWATWCGPCVHELPNVLKVYDKDHAKGFDIIGVSLDNEKDKLTSFIKEKDMTWPQAFDGKGWDGALPTQYGIASIPATYLLKDGKIIGKDLRGDDLDTAVTAALSAN